MKKETKNTVKLLALSIILLLGFSFVNALVGNQTAFAKKYVTDLIEPGPPTWGETIFGEEADGTGVGDETIPCSIFGGLWEEPTATPPSENAPSPINVTNGTQKKVGCIKIGADENPLVELDVAGTTWTDYLSVWNTSYFKGDVFLGGTPYVTDAGVDLVGSGYIFANWGDNAINDINQTVEDDLINIEEVDIGKGGNIRIDGLRPAFQGLTNADYPTQVCTDSDGRLVTCEIVEEVIPEYDFNDMFVVLGMTASGNQGYKSCPATHPHAIAGGVTCGTEGFGESEIMDSRPGIAPVTDMTINYGAEYTDNYNAWWGECSGAAGDDDIFVWVTCTK